ncbi:MAG: glycosyltransferase [Lachnospiraceae bacterium]
MNIGLFTDTYYPEVNGVANSTYELKCNLEKMGHTVYVFTVTNPKAAAEEEPGVFRMTSVPFIFLKDRRVGIPQMHWWWKKINSISLDVIHTQTEFTMGHLGKKTAQHFNIPHIHTYHTIYEDYTHYLKLPGNESMKKAARMFSRMCCNRADTIIVPTEKVRKLLYSYHVKKSIHVIPTGVDVTKFSHYNEKRRCEIRESLHLEDDHHVLIYLGRISKEKNLEEVLIYFKEVIAEDEQARLMVVGGGPQLPLLKELARALGIEQYTCFVGEVNWEEVQDYYAVGDIFVSASTSETQGLTYAEALAAGKPLLVHKDECLKDLLVHKENGYEYESVEEFVEGYQYLVNKCKETGLRDHMIQSMQHFSGMEFARKVYEVYEKVCTK